MNRDLLANLSPYLLLSPCPPCIGFPSLRPCVPCAFAFIPIRLSLRFESGEYVHGVHPEGRDRVGALEDED